MDQKVQVKYIKSCENYPKIGQCTTAKYILSNKNVRPKISVRSTA